MDNEEKRPNAALINREWFEAASGALDRDGLGRVLVAAVSYVFGKPSGDLRNPVESAVFRMIIPSLDSDVRKYVERCARNAANARRGFERVAASGSESVPVVANTTTTSTSTSTTTSTSKPSLSPDDERKRERFIVYGYFWSTGSQAAGQELDAFWDYYESLGWKNNKGAVIVSKIACARQWHRQFETGTFPDGAPVWYSFVKNCPVPDINVFRAYAGAERIESGAVVRLRCTAQFLDDLRKVMPDLEKSLQGAWRVPAVTFELVR